MIETTHLFIVPLNYQQLLKYSKNDDSLEMELKLQPSEREISIALAEALKETILPNVANNPSNYYSTLWTIISKAENKMVGDLCFLGSPDETGSVEIGYGTYSAFRNEGKMTEAVEGIITWVKAQKNVNTITAKANKNNIASLRILEKNNFIRGIEMNDEINWSLVLS